MLSYFIFKVTLLDLMNAQLFQFHGSVITDIETKYSINKHV
jgi:hypothetical protein